MKSFEHFYYGEVRETAKTNAVSLISAQFEKMRENMQWSTNPATSNAKVSSTTTQVLSPLFKSNPLESDIETPFVNSSNRSVQSNASSTWKKHPSVPSHIVPRSPSRSQKSKLQAVKNNSYNSPEENFTAADLLHSAAPSCNKFNDNREAEIPCDELSLSYTGSADKQQSRTLNPHVSLPDRPTLLRTLGGSALSLTASGSDNQCISPSMHTFRGKRNVSVEQLRQDLVLHHDIFLAGRDDDVVEAVNSISRRRQWAVPRYPQSTDAVQIDYSLRPNVKNTPRTVPSRVVVPRDTVSSEQRRLRAKQSVMRPLCPTRSRSLSPTARHNAQRSRSVPTTSRLSASPNLERIAAAGNEAEVEAMPLTAQSLSSTAEAAFGSDQIQTGSDSRPQLSRRDTGVMLPANLCAQAITTLAEREPSPTTVTERLSPITVPTVSTTAAVVANTKASVCTNSTPSRTTKGKGVVSQPASTCKSVTSSSAMKQQPQQKQIGKSGKAGSYTRPLTAAEHAGAQALSTKLTAANLAWHREATSGVDVLPRRQVSRALSQLVYCVRPDEN